MQRVLWVDLLNLLALEGPSGERVRATLDTSGLTTYAGVGQMLARCARVRATMPCT